MNDRDTFAAAALTGLLADDGDRTEHAMPNFTARAYEWADAMLRERERHHIPDAGKMVENTTNHDAVPVAWAVRYKPCDTGVVALCRTLAECRDQWSNRATDHWRYVPLYSHPQSILTDEEREAIYRAEARLRTAYVPDDETAATLRSLLARIA